MRLNLKSEECRLKQLYYDMIKIRIFEEKVLAVCEENEMPGSAHLYIGEEAIAVGVCAALTSGDQICTTYRGHGHCIAKGGDLKTMMAEIFGRSSGYCGGRAGSDHISSRELGMLGASGIVGAGSPIAVGAAFAQKYKNTKDVTVVFFGDGASNRGTQHEAMNLAALWKLPVIFVVENNRFGFFTAQEKHQKIKDISVRAAAYGFEGVTADGNDVLEVYEVAKTAVEKCRNGEGPVLLEYKTWRHYGHFFEDSEPYKDPEEQKYWVTKRDPVKNFGKYLIKNKIYENEGELDKIRKELEKQVEEAVDYARRSSWPDSKNVCVGTFYEGQSEQ